MKSKPLDGKMRLIIMTAIIATALLGSAEFTEVSYGATSSAETKPTYTIGFEDREIIEAFRNGDDERLNGFFRRWEMHSHEISGDELALCPEQIKTIYELFETFYCENRARLEKEMAAQRAAQAKSQNKGRESSQPEVAEKQEYLIIQNNLKFVVLDSNEYENHKRMGSAEPGWYELRNFRPRISCMAGRKVLYLDKTHERALNYLFNETNGDSSGCREHDKKKEMFLAEKLLLHHGHWGRYYHYITFPQVFTIVLNSNLDKAYINCRDHWYGGSLWEYKKENDGWRMAGRIMAGAWRE